MKSAAKKALVVKRLNVVASAGIGQNNKRGVNRRGCVVQNTLSARNSEIGFRLSQSFRNLLEGSRNLSRPGLLNFSGGAGKELQVSQGIVRSNSSATPASGNPPKIHHANSDIGIRTSRPPIKTHQTVGVMHRQAENSFSSLIQQIAPSTLSSTGWGGYDHREASTSRSSVYDCNSRIGNSNSSPYSVRSDRGRPPIHHQDSGITYRTQEGAIANKSGIRITYNEGIPGTGVCPILNRLSEASDRSDTDFQTSDCGISSDDSEACPLTPVKMKNKNKRTTASNKSPKMSKKDSMKYFHKVKVNKRNTDSITKFQGCKNIHEHCVLNAITSTHSSILKCTLSLILSFKSIDSKENLRKMSVCSHFVTPIPASRKSSVVPGPASRKCSIVPATRKSSLVSSSSNLDFSDSNSGPMKIYNQPVQFQHVQSGVKSDASKCNQPQNLLMLPNQFPYMKTGFKEGRLVTLPHSTASTPRSIRKAEINDQKPRDKLSSLSMDDKVELNRREDSELVDKSVECNNIVEKHTPKLAEKVNINYDIFIFHGGFTCL